MHFTTNVNVLSFNPFSLLWNSKNSTLLLCDNQASTIVLLNIDVDVTVRSHLVLKFHFLNDNGKNWRIMRLDNEICFYLKTRNRFKNMAHTICVYC